MTLVDRHVSEGWKKSIEKTDVDSRSAQPNVMRGCCNLETASKSIKMIKVIKTMFCAQDHQNLICSCDISSELKRVVLANPNAF